MDLGILAGNMELLPPMRIATPHCGFNGYLLRCGKSLHINEKGSDTFLVKRPGMGFAFEALPDDFDERAAIRKEWYHLCNSGEKLFVSVNFEPKRPLSDELMAQFQEMDGEDFVHAAESIDSFVRENMLPSFDLFAAVWHTGQIVPEYGSYRPPHAHFLYRKARRMTKAQNDIIIR